MSIPTYSAIPTIPRAIKQPATTLRVAGRMVLLNCNAAISAMMPPTTGAAQRITKTCPLFEPVLPDKLNTVVTPCEIAETCPLFEPMLLCEYWAARLASCCPVMDAIPKYVKNGIAKKARIAAPAQTKAMIKPAMFFCEDTSHLTSLRSNEHLHINEADMTYIKSA